MPHITLRPTFTRELSGLQRSARKQYQRASEILLELQLDQNPSAPRRTESRIPNCVKFELPDGYRLVLQRSDDDSELLALVVGTHDHVDSFLDGHKGYLFDKKTGRVRELRLATSAETSVEIAPSADLAEETIADTMSTQPVFHEFSDEMLARLGVPTSFVSRIKAITDPDGIECMAVLNSLEDTIAGAADALLAYVTGNSETRTGVIQLAMGEVVLVPTFPSKELAERSATGEEFFTFDDPDDLALVLKKGALQQWQLFLHPDQRALVERSFSGPARLRGISGSGKTVVALHRARRLARTALQKNERVLFTTFDKGLAAAASRLLDELTGEERSAIEVTHLHRWCLDYLAFCDLPRPQYLPDAIKEVRGQAIADLPLRTQDTLQTLGQHRLHRDVGVDRNFLTGLDGLDVHRPLRVYPIYDLRDGAA